MFQITNVRDAQNWLRRLRPDITPALKHVKRPEERDAPCVNVALTYTGLLALCQARGWTPSGFATPFVERIDGSC